MATENELVKDARDQLSLVLSFFPRVDAKLSTVLAIDTAMLAAISAAAPSFHQITIVAACAAILTAILLTFSFYNLYQGSFPNTKGGHSSIVYFRDIAARNEIKFLHDYSSCTLDSLREDLLAQVWRNSAILDNKYMHLKHAFASMALALTPWAIALASFSVAKQALNVVVR